MPDPPNAPASGRLPAGFAIGPDLVVERFVGAGGMGVVYAARHRHLRKTVAVKVLDPGGATPEKRRRFLREGRAVADVDHPNIVRVSNVFVDERVGPVLVMELLAGEPLRALLRREGRLALPAAAAIGVPVARALLVAHGKGIIHRDIKPENIFLAVGPDGTTVPKVLDFGIAKLPKGVAAGVHSTETAAGAVLGTLLYMSHEQAMAEEQVDRRTDIWSLGVVLYEMLAGRTPIQEGSLGQFFKVLLSGELASIRTWVPDLPPGVVSAIDRCLVRNRDERLGDLAELVEALSPHLPAPIPDAAPTTSLVFSSQLVATPLAQPVSAAPPARLRQRRAAVAVAAATGVGLAGWFAVAALRVPSPSSPGQVTTATVSEPPTAIEPSPTAALNAAPSPVLSAEPAPPASRVAPAVVAAGTRPGSTAPRAASNAGHGAAMPSVSAAASGPAPHVGIPERLPY